MKKFLFLILLSGCGRFNPYAGDDAAVAPATPADTDGAEAAAETAKTEVEAKPIVFLACAANTYFLGNAANAGTHDTTWAVLENTGSVRGTNHFQIDGVQHVGSRTFQIEKANPDGTTMLDADGKPVIDHEVTVTDFCADQKGKPILEADVAAVLNTSWTTLKGYSGVKVMCDANDGTAESMNVDGVEVIVPVCTPKSELPKLVKQAKDREARLAKIAQAEPKKKAAASSPATVPATNSGSSSPPPPTKAVVTGKDTDATK